MKTPGTKLGLTQFEKVFIGELVSIISDLSVSNTSQNDENYETNSAYMTFNGFLLDQDDEYCYLGETGNEVSSAIKKDSIRFIQVISPRNELDEILDSLPDNPEKDNEVN